MSKGTKVLVIFLLMFASASAFTWAQKAGYAQLGAFCAFATVGLLIALPVVALSRGGRSNRR